MAKTRWPGYTPMSADPADLMFYQEMSTERFFEQADRLGATSMIDLCRAALRMDGRDVPTGRMELV